jgi:hypothetical protein
MAFYDHPRINIQDNKVVRREWFLYAPLFFEDKSVLVSYYAVDSIGQRIDYYSFGLLVYKEGESEWLPKMEVVDLKFDDDNLPKGWRLHWSNHDCSIDVNISVIYTSLLEAWGNPDAPKARKDFVIFPLVLKGDCTIKRNNKIYSVKGYGISEYWRMTK